MRLLFFVALVIGLLLAPMGVFAEETNVSANESETVTTPEEGTNQEVPSANLAQLFGKVHATLLMSTEEAYGYLLMNNESEKQAYFDEVVASQAAFAAFEDAAATAGENESTIVAGYESTLKEYGTMTVAADTMFASFEAEGKPVMEDVVAFEKSVDTVFNATDNAWLEFHTESDGPSTADAGVRALYGRLLSAVQESYAYPVLGDEAEKEDALADFVDFDTRVAQYEEKFTDTSFDDLKAIKDEIQKAAEILFTRYEKDGQVDVKDVEVLENLVEEMNADYIRLNGQESSDTALINDEIPVVNDTALNTTA